MLDEALLYDVALGTAVRAGYSMRAGGVSAPPYDSLNLGSHVDDEAAAVARNQAVFAAAIGVDAQTLRWAEQVHGETVAIVDANSPPTAPGVDALVTSSPGVVLCVRSADCLPVLFADVDARVIGAAHAGRTGLAAGVLPATVRAMEEVGAHAARVRAVIGPAVCGRCYEVPEDMARRVDAAVPGALSYSASGTPSLDLVAGAVGQLQGHGISTIDVVAECTVEQPQRWFSYRRDGRTGRFAGFVVML